MTGPLVALKLAVIHAFDFKGSTTRSEFWWTFLAVGIVGIIIGLMDTAKLITLSTSQDLTALTEVSLFDFITPYYVVLITIPCTSLSIRRLHDAGMSGFWWLLSFVPVVGGIGMLVLYCLPSSGRTSAPTTSNMSTTKPSAKAAELDAHQKAMQGYAHLFNKDKPVSKAVRAAQKAEVSDYYRTRVLKSAPAA